MCCLQCTICHQLTARTCLFYGTRSLGAHAIVFFFHSLKRSSVYSDNLFRNMSYSNYSCDIQMYFVSETLPLQYIALILCTIGMSTYMVPTVRPTRWPTVIYILKLHTPPTSTPLIAPPPFTRHHSSYDVLYRVQRTAMYHRHMIETYVTVHTA